MGTFLVTLARLAKASLTRVRSGREGPILPPLPSEIHLVRGQVSASLSLFLGVYLHYLTPQAGLPPQTFLPSLNLPQPRRTSSAPAAGSGPGRLCLLAVTPRAGSCTPPDTTGGAGAGISSGCHTARWKQHRFHVSNRKHLLRHITPFSYSRE